MYTTPKDQAMKNTSGTPPKKDRIRVFVFTNGCPESRMETAMICRYLDRHPDYRLVTDCAEADLIIFLGCSVTQDKEDLSLQIAKALNLSKRPDAEILVAGCIAKIRPELENKDPKHRAILEELQRIARFENTSDLVTNIPPVEFWKGSEAILGPEVARAFVCDYVRQIHKDSKPLIPWELSSAAIWLITRYRRLIDRELNFDSSKTFCIKVSTGCKGNCSYCSIKLARGDVISKPIPDIVEEFRRGRDQGYRDFALLGTDLGDYGKDRGDDLMKLLESLVRQNGDFILRLRNINPRCLIPSATRLGELLQSGKINYILSPVQSGSDHILGLMGRGYRVGDYMEAVRTLRKAYPRLFLKTQIIVGFPGETEDDFEKTRTLLKSSLFDYVDVYAFTPRPMTRAADLPDRVPDPVIMKRYRALAMRTFFQLPLRQVARHFWT